MAEKTKNRGSADAHKLTLGSLRLRHHETNELILIPTPSNDPNDPLNWYGFCSSSTVSSKYAYTVQGDSV